MHGFQMSMCLFNTNINNLLKEKNIVVKVLILSPKI